MARGSEVLGGSAEPVEGTRYENLEGVDKPYAEYERRMALYNRGRGGEGLMGPKREGGQVETANEKATYAKLEELKAKRKAMEDPGVEVEFRF